MANHDDYPAGRSPRGGCLLLLCLLVLCVAGGLLLWEYWPVKSSGLNPQAVPRAIVARGELSPAEKTNIEIYEQASQSLVQVTNLAKQSRDWLSLNVQQVPRGVGSGFVWDQDVVDCADSAQVTLSDHSTYHARQMWTYPDQDIAVLWIDAPRARLRPILLGSSHDLKVGQITYALGDPFGLDQTMTMGIVSALGRTIDSENGQTISGVIQTSSPINPGNSGGPLLDSAGRLIGMNTAILSTSGTFAGIGFAIPVDEVNRVVLQLIKHGKVVRPRLGVQVASDELAKTVGVDDGALIVKVMPNSAAAAAGLRGTDRDEAGHIKLGDIVTAVDGQPVHGGEDLHTLLENYHVGDTFTITILRDGEQKEVQAKLVAAS